MGEPGEMKRIAQPVNRIVINSKSLSFQVIAFGVTCYAARGNLYRFKNVPAEMEKSTFISLQLVAYKGVSWSGLRKPSC